MFLACFDPSDDKPGGDASDGTNQTEASDASGSDGSATATDAADTTASTTGADIDSSEGGCPPAVFGEARFGDACFSP